MKNNYAFARKKFLHEIQRCFAVVLTTTCIGFIFSFPLVGVSIGLAYVLYGQLLHVYTLHKKLEKFDSIKNIDVNINNLNSNKQLEELLVILQRNAQRVDKRFSKTRNQFKQFLTVFNNLPIGIIIIKKNGTIMLANQAVHTITGIKKSDRSLLLTMLLRNPNFIDFFSKKIYGSQVIFSQGGKYKKDIQTERIACDDIFDLLIFRDVSYHEKQQQLHKRFIADASHELQSPLTIIRGNAELAKITTDMHNNQYIGEIIQQVDNMTCLIRSLLTLARIDDKKPRHDQQWLLPHNIIFMAAKMAQKETNSSHNICYELQNDISLYINKNDLFIIVRNLLDNAIKYSSSNSTIQVLWRYGSWKQNCPRKKTKAYGILEIIDQGLGISRQEIDNITKRFYQVRSSQSIGHGLGLSIVTGLLRAYKARLFIDSEMHKGSRFGCIFPHHTVRTSSTQEHSKNDIKLITLS